MSKYFGIGIHHPKFDVNVGGLFRSAYCFGASFAFSVGRRYEKQASDTTNTKLQMPFYEFESIESVKRHLPFSCLLIGVELAPQAEPLQTFTHPPRAIYLLGAEDHGLPPSILQQCHKVLQIDNLKACLNVTTAGSIVMYDRLNKEQRK